MTKKEVSKGEQTPLALGNMLGSMAPRVRAGMEDRIAECGQRQQGVTVGAGEQYGFGAAPLLIVASQQEGQTGARGRGQSRTLVSVIPTTPGCSWNVCLGEILLPSEQSGPVTSLSAFQLLQQEACWGLLGSFPSSFVLFLSCSPDMVPTHSGTSTYWI